MKSSGRNRCVHSIPFYVKASSVHYVKTFYDGFLPAFPAAAEAALCPSCEASCLTGLATTPVADSSGFPLTLSFVFGNAYAYLSIDFRRYFHKTVNSCDSSLSLNIKCAGFPWSCCIRHKIATARLLGLRGRIALKVLMFVSCEWCVLVHVEVSATGRSLVQGSPTEFVIVCDQVQQQPSTLTMVKWKENWVTKKGSNYSHRQVTTCLTKHPFRYSAVLLHRIVIVCLWLRAILASKPSL